MRKLISRLAVVFAGACAAAAVLSMSGCEESGADSLSVTPRYVTIGPNITTFELNVVGGTKALSFPLEWSVANSSLGRIVSNSGAWAVYSRTATHGVNTVTVRDQYGAEV
ncbi:MAG: hypothetical protein E4H19_15745 [Chromatiales bacterium]|nr:MAG: hypothetical protein E4H19_15745 [Chromatiales bacterium]